MPTRLDAAAVTTELLHCDRLVRLSVPVRCSVVDGIKPASETSDFYHNPKFPKEQFLNSENFYKTPSGVALGYLVSHCSSGGDGAAVDTGADRQRGKRRCQR
jgi:hypothetical protein